MPDTAMLLQLADKANIDLDWLLMEKGGCDVWTPCDPNADRQFELMIEAELRVTETATTEEFQAVWDYLKGASEFAQSENVILTLAVAGVRQRFQEGLRYVRDSARIFEINFTIFPEVKLTGNGIFQRSARAIMGPMQAGMMLRDAINKLASSKRGPTKTRRRGLPRR